jgi:RNA polymerase sigma-70 factor, ECF subfamily
VNLLPPERNREAMDDDELIAAMAGSDDTALRELFARHAPWLAARLRPILPAADVEDVLQESFLAVWRAARGHRVCAGQRQEASRFLRPGADEAERPPDGG